ncbi:hypothetical protein F6P62_01910 [Streptococcus suis]|nr:hypothetical protein [Streptococcus suis]
MPTYVAPLASVIQSFSFSFITSTYEETPFPYFQLQIISSLFELALPYLSTACSFWCERSSLYF